MLYEAPTPTAVTIVTLWSSELEVPKDRDVLVYALVGTLTRPEVLDELVRIFGEDDWSPDDVGQWHHIIITHKTL